MEEDLRTSNESPAKLIVLVSDIVLFCGRHFMVVTYKNQRKSERVISIPAVEVCFFVKVNNYSFLPHHRPVQGWVREEKPL